MPATARILLTLDSCMPAVAPLVKRIASSFHLRASCVSTRPLPGTLRYILFTVGGMGSETVSLLIRDHPFYMASYCFQAVSRS